MIRPRRVRRRGMGDAVPVPACPANPAIPSGTPACDQATMAQIQQSTPTSTKIVDVITLKGLLWRSAGPTPAGIVVYGGLVWFLFLRGHR